MLRKESLHASVSDPVSESMNFLNEVAGRFPDAISLAAGRPYEGFFAVEDIHRHITTFEKHLAGQGVGEVGIRRTLMQYGRTNGVIHDLIARTLATDEGIDVPPSAVAVTTGCQEAMIIVLRGLCAAPTDVLLAASPCYVGITGAARILGIEVVPVEEGPDGLTADAVAHVAQSVRASGRTPKALYLVPDFANPSGACLDVPSRHALLDVAETEDIVILEDDPYGLFGLDDRPRPRLKALDTRHRVIYLGSFAKSVFPGARVGYLVADQPVVDAAGRVTLLAEELATVKSMLTVNTSPIAQAVIGGMLIESDFSLRNANAERIEFYRRNLKELIAALGEYLPGGRWNSPAGGFFLVLESPIVADAALLEISAHEYGVLWTPMSFFYPDGGGSHAIRLACSYLEPAEIREGVRRLATLLHDRASA